MKKLEKSNTTITVVIAIVALLVGAGVGYYMAPSDDVGDSGTTVTVEVSPLAGKTIRIGYIAPSVDALETTVPLFNDMVVVDINDYLSKLSYDTEVEFLIDQANHQVATHLEKVQGFRSMDIEIFIGGAYSSMAQGALNYVTENNMMMVSSSSTSPLLSLPNDRLFRTCPTDYVQAPAIANMWKSWGADAILILQKGDSHADGIYNVLVPELEQHGIAIIERIRFATESTEFSPYLATMNDLLGAAKDEYGVDRIGVQTMIGDAEAVLIMTQTPDFPNTNDVIWMSTEEAGRSQRMLDDGLGLQNDVGYFSSLMTPAKSWKWERLDKMYFDLVSQNANFYTAADYDAAWCLALSVLTTESLLANEVVEVWPDTPNNFFGASGWVDLDENGDRKPGIFDIWGFSSLAERGFTIYGQYNGMEISVYWNDAVLKANGFIRPGSE